MTIRAKPVFCLDFPSQSDEFERGTSASDSGFRLSFRFHPGPSKQGKQPLAELQPATTTAVSFGAPPDEPHIHAADNSSQFIIVAAVSDVDSSHLPAFSISLSLCIYRAAQNSKFVVVVVGVAVRIRKS